MLCRNTRLSRLYLTYTTGGFLPSMHLSLWGIVFLFFLGIFLLIRWRLISRRICFKIFPATNRCSIQTNGDFSARIADVDDFLVSSLLSSLFPFCSGSVKRDHHDSTGAIRLVYSVSSPTSQGQRLDSSTQPSPLRRRLLGDRVHVELVIPRKKAKDFDLSVEARVCVLLFFSVFHSQLSPRPEYLCWWYIGGSPGRPAVDSVPPWGHYPAQCRLLEPRGARPGRTVGAQPRAVSRAALSNYRERLPQRGYCCCPGDWAHCDGQRSTVSGC